MRERAVDRICSRCLSCGTTDNSIVTETSMRLRRASKVNDRRRERAPVATVGHAIPRTVRLPSGAVLRRTSLAVSFISENAAAQEL